MAKQILRYSTFVGSVLLLCACTTVEQAPISLVSSAEASIRQAESLGASEHAPVALNNAREHLRNAREEMDDKNSRLLERNRLNSYVPRATTELKNFYVLQKIKEVKDAMKSGDQNDYVTLINQLQQLQEMKKVLAKELGERIVLKYFN